MKKVIFVFLLSFIFFTSLIYAEAKWTWMLYLLEDGTGLDGMDDLNEWEANGSTSDVNYIVLIDASDDSKDGVYYIQHDSNGYDSTFRSPRVSTQFGTDPDMSDWHTLRDFMNYCYQNYPAQHYGLTLWDHGNGIFKGEVPGGGIFGSIFNENSSEEPKDFVDGMKLWELSQALSDFNNTIGRKVDIVGFDVCLLGQIETAYQLKDYVDYVIASEKTEPADGWDYVGGFSDMTNNNGNITALEQASNIVDSYVSFYASKNGESSGVTQAATSTQLLEQDLIPALNTFADKLRRDVYNYETKIKNARNNASYWDGSDFIDHRDLGSFADIIKNDTSLPSDLRDAAQDVLDAISSAVVREGHTVTAPAYGLKIWMPEDIDNDSNESYYMDPDHYLTFSNTLWDEYLYNYNNPQPYDSDRPPVQNLTAIVGDGFVTLNWEAPSKNTLDHYKINRNGSLLVDNIPANTTTYTDNNVSNGTTYNYDVYAVYTGSPSGDSSPNSISATPNPPYTLPYSQDFSSGTLPAGWENIDNQGNGQIWQFNNPGGRTFNSTTQSNGFAILDSDNYGSGNSQNADLVSPIFDMSNYASVTLHFEHYFREYSGSSATLSYSVDGADWTVIQTWTSSTNNATTFEQSFGSEICGHSNVRFKWNYTGTFGYYWCVDDLSITGVQNGNPEFSLSPTSLDFGNVEIGHSVTKQFTITNTGDGGILTGEITTPNGYTVALASKEKQPNGGKNTLSYSISSQETFNLTFNPTIVGNYDGTVTITCNEDTSQNLSVLGNGVAADLVTTPNSTLGLSQTMLTNQTATENLKLENVGGANLSYTATIDYGKNSKEQILYENFENGGSIPNGWTQEYVSGSTDWIYTNGGHSGHPASAHSGSYNAQLYYNNSSGIVTKLITPKIDFGGYTENAQLTFWHTQANWYSDQDELRVYYKASSSDSWHLLAEYTNSVTDWTQRVLNLPNPSNEYYIAFEGTAKWGYGVCIDDVEVTGDTAYSWLTINGTNNYSGDITVNGFENLTIGFNSSGLTEGTYNANININSNDPDSPTILPVTLTVEANSDNSSEGSNNNGDGTGSADVDVPPISTNGDVVDPDVSVDPTGDVPIVVNITVNDTPQHGGVSNESTLLSYSVSVTGNTSNVSMHYILSYEGLSQTPVSVLWWNSSISSWQSVDSPSWDTPSANHVSFDLIIPETKDGNTEFVITKDNPLPIVFGTFTSVYSNGKAILHWNTKSEENSNYWNIYKSKSKNFGQSYKINVSPIDGANTTTQETNYTFIDQTELLNNFIYYYWLENVTYSGENTLFGPFDLKVEDNNEDNIVHIIKYGLQQNYPNPFNPETTINFALKKDANVTLEIFNIKGEKVKTLLSNTHIKKDTEINVIWNGTNEIGEKVSSGIYYYKLSYQGKQVIRKMLLLK